MIPEQELRTEIERLKYANANLRTLCNMYRSEMLQRSFDDLMTAMDTTRGEIEKVSTYYQGELERLMSEIDDLRNQRTYWINKHDALLLIIRDGEGFTNVNDIIRDGKMRDEP